MKKSLFLQYDGLKENLSFDYKNFADFGVVLR